MINITDPELIADLCFNEYQDIPFHLYWKDKHNKYLGANNHLAKDLGFSTGSKIPGYTDSDFFPNDVNSLKSNDNRVIIEDRNIIYLERGTLPSNNAKIIAVSHKVPLRTHYKKVIGIIGISFILKKKQFYNFRKFI